PRRSRRRRSRCLLSADGVSSVGSSSPETPGNALGDTRADALGAAARRDGAAGYPQPLPRRLPRQVLGESVAAEQERQLLLQARGDAMMLARCNAVDAQSADVNADALHTQPRISKSVSGRSIFCASPRAACRRWLMRRCVFSSAARKAALRAMLRMLPPARLACARRR